MEHDEERPPTAAYEHRAPPYDRRPWSRLAIWSLLIALAASFLLSPSGLFLLFLPLAALAVWAVVRVKPAFRKGHALAVAALVIVLMGGSCSYMTAKSAADTVERVGLGVLAALSSRNEPQRLDDWLTREARQAGVDERIRARYQAVTERYGPYQKAMVEESVFLGSLPYVAVDPDAYREIEPDAGDVEAADEAERPPAEGARDAAPAALEMWGRARFERGTVRLRFLLTRDVWALARVRMEPGQAEKPEVLEDLRFYADE